MSEELIKELSRLQLLSSRCKNKMSMCPLSITREENRAYIVFNYIKELKNQLEEINYTCVPNSDIKNVIDKYKAQQKDFIDWLSNTIKEMENTPADYIRQQIEKDSCLAVADAILSKYKEIIGVENDKVD